MKDKYWAKEKYGKVDPLDYELQRFATPAGKLIDEAEKKAVLDLLIKNIPKRCGKGGQILDVATGPGRLAFYIEEHMKNAKITAIDINENMLARARNMAKEKKSNIKFIKGDIYNLPFKKEQFDAVVGLRFSMHLSDMDQVVKELSWVLKKEGLLIFDIFNYDSILRLRGKDGYYTFKELVDMASNYSLGLKKVKGVLLLGETIIRRLPSIFFPFIFPLVNPPGFLQMISTKLILCFKKL